MAATKKRIDTRKGRKRNRPLKPPKLSSRATCIVCGQHVGRTWVRNAGRLRSRWGFELAGGGRTKGQPRKVRDLPVAAFAPDAIKAWLPGTAETMAAMVASAMADLLTAGWSFPQLAALAHALRQRGYVERVVEYVIAQSPQILGTASDVARVLPGGRTLPPMGTLPEVRANVLDGGVDLPPMSPFGSERKP